MPAARTTSLNHSRSASQRATVVVFAVLTLAASACGLRTDTNESAAAVPVASAPVLTDAPGAVSSPENPASSPADAAVAAPAGAPSSPAGSASQAARSNAAAPAVGRSGTAAPSAAPTVVAAAPKTGSATAPSPGGTPQPGASGAGAVTPAPGPGGPKSTIKLGSFGQESGPIGALVQPTIVAAKAWAADVNARGGLNGHPVSVLFADDGGDPARALAIVKNMVEKEKVLSIFAEHAPVTVASVMPYLEQVQVARVGSVEGNAAVDKSPVSFHVTVGADKGTSWSHLLPLKEMAPEAKKIHLIYCREVQNCKNFRDHIVNDGYAKQLGMEVVGESQSSLAQPDYTPEVIAAKNAGAQAIVVIMENASVLRVARAVKRQGGGLLVATQQSMDTESFYKNGGADAEGVIGATATAAWGLSPKMKDYRDAVARFVPGGERGDFGAAAWASGKLLERVASSLGTEPKPADLLSALYSLQNETLGGIVPPLTFPKSRSHENVNHCVVVGKVANGKFAPKDNDPDKFVCAPGWKPETP